MRKFYNFETMFKSLKEELTEFLKESGIYYEVSGCEKGYHFEIKCNNEEVEKINNWLDDHTVTEVA